ncbi:MULTISPECIES: glycoside hydrolase family 108 protein [Burkholderiaceae]|uniref:glycoside hydrolase family 108 protein n=1 Tax=Burkholderiaceae TaxID=119060 RepID=UPI0009658321|nr:MULTISPECIES: glycosyl hydrolase 108 family protein [Burkholderiaceae]MCG1019773.1 glycoside hydrolase family 108 protein [Mycetohabitans sp. B4]SIT79893.1 Predicted Peptidoglycan domain-containing protein [Burkholderia sp. b13]
MSVFDDAFDKLIGNEGGYSNNPHDPGGETMWGVTQRVARAWGYTGPMRELPRETAKQIAKALYWDPLHCDRYDARVAFQIFDANYNGGHVVIWMQQASGAFADGKLGPKTIAAVQAVDPELFIMRFIAARLTYLTALQTWPSFGRGWARRIATNLRVAGA